MSILVSWLDIFFAIISTLRASVFADKLANLKFFGTSFIGYCHHTIFVVSFLHRWMDFHVLQFEVSHVSWHELQLLVQYWVYSKRRLVLFGSTLQSLKFFYLRISIIFCDIFEMFHFIATFDIIFFKNCYDFIENKT